MARWFGRYWIILTVVATPLVYAPLSGRGGEERAKQRSLDTLAEVMTLVQKEAVEPPTAKQATHASIQGMLHTLDPHSNYMDEGEFRSLREDQRGTFFGIGAMIQQQPDGVVITSIVRGGPAEKMGLRPGDAFKEIDGKVADGLTSAQVVQRLRGDKGTVVEVTVQRPGYAENLKFSITRAEIPSNSVYYSFMLTPTTGFITIKDFGETTSEEFQKAILNLKRQGMKELILDLRYNPGGLLDAAIGICRQLLGPNEIIVSQRGRQTKQVSVTRTPAGGSLDPFPLVILINRGSAVAHLHFADGGRASLQRTEKRFASQTDSPSTRCAYRSAYFRLFSGVLPECHPETNRQEQSSRPNPPIHFGTVQRNSHD